MRRVLLARVRTVLVSVGSVAAHDYVRTGARGIRERFIGSEVQLVSALSHGKSTECIVLSRRVACRHNLGVAVPGVKLAVRALGCDVWAVCSCVACGAVWACLEAVQGREPGASGSGLCLRHHSASGAL